MRGLHHFLCTIEHLVALIFFVINLIFEFNLQLNIQNFSHHTLSVNHLDVETWTNVLNKRNGILEIFRMLIEGAHKIGTIVLIGSTVLSLILLAKRNADIGIIVVLLANIT